MNSIAILLMAMPGPLQLDLPRPQVAVSPGVRSPVSGALNADAHTDLVAVDRERSELLVTLGLGNGHFSDPVAFPTGPQPQLVRLADLDQDGILDAVVAWQGGSSGGLSIHLGDGLGGFGPHLQRALPWPPELLIVEDLNGNGIPDVLVVGAPPNDSTALVLLGNGSGGFSGAIANDLGAAVNAVATGDLDGDPHRDLFASAPAPGASTVRLFSGAGDGSFALAGSLAVADQPWSIAVADLDADGNDDLTVILGPGFPSGGTLETYLGDGTGGFGAPSSAPTSSGWSQHVLADVDGNGHLDAVVGWNLGSFGLIAVHPGLGTGAFGPALFGSWVPSYRGFTVADSSGVAGLDLVYAQGGIEFSGLPVGFLGVVRQQAPGEFEGPTVERLGFFDGRAVLSRDVDGDGLDDVVSIGNASFDTGALAVHYGDGSGGFSGHTRRAFPSVPWSSPTWQLLLGHLDGDGFVDALGWDGEELLLFRGLAGGRFAAPIAMGSYHRPPALADFDGDGLEELVVGRFVGGPNPHEISIQGLVGNSFIGLAQVPTIGPPRKVVSADFDGDGNQDFAHQVEDPPLVRVHLGNGDFTFAGPQDLAVPSPLGDLIAVDLNGDGLPELVASIPASNSVIVWPNLGGSFGPPVRRAVGQRPNGLASADFDGDGRQDVVVFHEEGSNLAVLSGQVGTLLGPARYFALPPFPATSPGVFVAAPGERPDILFTTIGSPMTMNFEAFLLLENLTP